MPVVHVRVSLPNGGEPVAVSMIVDTGADRTLLPASVVRELGLPPVGVIEMRGIGNTGPAATVHGAAVSFGPFRSLIQVIAFMDEAILGRDVLNRFVATLDGPALTLSINPRRPSAALPPGGKPRSSIASPRRKRPT